ncbi:MAG: WYL domain-containing protein [Flavobacteriaceae bacterium]|jgi:predicted DNA-binding transcriptional regulator YafY|nr:WYL domain-containing protein [Flavobacteriaceae bacterium]
MKKLRYYFLILNYLQEKGTLSREELLNHLREFDIDISERTFYRALSELEAEYSIEIKHKNAQGGYFIIDSCKQQAKVVLSCLKNLVTSDILMTEHSNKYDLNDFITLENTHNTVPINTLKKVLLAVINHKKISFEYFNAQKGHVKEHVLSPFFFKQYQDQWFVVGKDGQALKSFTLDHMSDIQILAEGFKENIAKAKKIYEELLGVYHSEEKLQEVVLAFDRGQETTLRALPIHHSQVIENDPSNESLIVKLALRPNTELKQQVLKYGSLVEVVEPKWLREELIHELEHALSFYRA